MTLKPFPIRLLKVSFTGYLVVLILLLVGCQAPAPYPATPTPNSPTVTAQALNTGGPAISPLLVGNNVWMYPDMRVWNIAGQAGLKIIRIGGIAYDQNMPPNTMLTEWVNNIKAMGAEPMIQVSRFNGPEVAAGVVKYFNLETKNRVKFWNIGNEPYCNKATSTTADEVAAYIKPIASAMKAADPTIKIFAPDECYLMEYYSNLLMGDNSPADISGKVPGQAYYFIDGLSWHLYVGYPPESIAIEALTTAGARSFLDSIQKTRNLIDRANAAQGRVGAEALQWGIGEFNSSDGPRVCSFENGQMFAEVYGYIMKYGGTYGETWSMFENGGRCTTTDYSFVDANIKPRPTYYHMQMISQNFSGSYLDGTSNLEAVRAFGSVDVSKGQITVMLLNLDTAAPHTCSLRLDQKSAAAADCLVSIPAGLAVTMEKTIASQTSLVMVFNLQGQLIKTITYSKGDAAPQTATPP